MSAAQQAPIMLVDDDTDALEMMCILLESAGFAVHPIEDGHRALHHLRHGARPSVILLDMMMPVMNGWQFRDEMRRHPELADIPVVVLTGDGRAEQKAREIEADGYLKKPVDLEDLVAAVQRYGRAA